jgi:hypothetical protein
MRVPKAVKYMCVSKHLLLISALALVAAAPAFPKDSGFNGKWVLDKSASTASFDIPDNLMQQIKTKGSELDILTTWREPANGIAPMGLLGVMTTNLKLNVNGEEERNQFGPFNQVSKTTVNGNQILTDYTAMANGQQVTGHWTRSLSGDGRQMTLEITQNSGAQNNQAKLVFHRK